MKITATTNCRMRMKTKLRFVLSNMTVEIMRIPSVPDYKFIILAYRVNGVKGPNHKLVILDRVFHDRDGVNGLPTNKVIFNNGVIMARLEGATDAQEIEGSFTVPRSPE